MLVADFAFMINITVILLTFTYTVLLSVSRATFSPFFFHPPFSIPIITDDFSIFDFGESSSRIVFQFREAVAPVNRFSFIPFDFYRAMRWVPSLNNNLNGSVFILQRRASPTRLFGTTRARAFSEKIATMEPVTSALYPRSF